MKKTALIMAGGRGERFWPKSRSALPKQFLSLTGDGKTMIQLTVERIRSLVELEDIYVATNESYRSLVLEQLPGLPPEIFSASRWDATPPPASAWVRCIWSAGTEKR